MDLADQAEENNAKELAALLRSARATEMSLKPIGVCYFCSEKTRQGYKFCSSECRDDWEKEQAALKRNGG